MAIQVKETDPQGTLTTTKLDEWDRVVERTSGAGNLQTLGRFFCDAAGRLKPTERKQGARQ